MCNDLIKILIRLKVRKSKNCFVEFFRNNLTEKFTKRCGQSLRVNDQHIPRTRTGQSVRVSIAVARFLQRCPTLRCSFSG